MNTKKAQTTIILSILLTTFLAANLLTGSASVVTPDWQVTLISEVNGYNSKCILGVSNLATAAFDTMIDDLAAPYPQRGVASWFYYPSNPSGVVNYQKLSTSIIPLASSGLTWTYKIQPVNEEGAMTISWSASEVAAISGFNAYLQDSTGTTNLADMMAVTSYSYASEMDVPKTFIVRLVPTLAVPEYPIVAASVIAFFACFAAFGITKIVRNKNHNLTIPSF